jgi:hypothetical protein
MSSKINLITKSKLETLYAVYYLGYLSIIGFKRYAIPLDWEQLRCDSKLESSALYHKNLKQLAI